MITLKKLLPALLIFIVIDDCAAQSGGSSSSAPKPTTTTTATSTGSSPVLGPAVTYPDAIYINENSPYRKVIPYTPLRQADAAWSKRVWRTIDMREKFNMPLYYPEERIANRRSMYDVMKDELMRKGSPLHAFGNPLFNDEFQIPLTPSEIENMFVTWDSTHVEENPNKPGTYDTIPLKDEVMSKNVTQLWIKEDWFTDKQRSVQDVRILGICPLKEKVINGQVVGYSPMFWIYYPEWRQTFANNEVFNVKTDAERRTMEDVIWKRMFHSYVHKESNVYDRHIQDYATGLDALYESDRIKDEILMTEHDVWHF